MPSAVVVDASVVVEFVAQRDAYLFARRLFDALDWTEPLEMYAPDLIFAETGEAIRGLVRGKKIRAEYAEASLRDALALSIRGVATRLLALDAFGWRHDASFYDACYLALAARLGAPVVSMDAGLLDVARRGRVSAFALASTDLAAWLASQRSGGAP